ncbi:LamG-like jellyroll fold domain-containing protein [Polaribacter sp. SA4-12]|uniref:LamG-like jellyroll fold domain-containing protein n=1 Tax=Polaribacter sp. SA4-12 TaxID=1312072 RepID=UPI0018E01A79|nr:LamG-like jellyroll fold domain-containing protein [Polaribacter sp. SA4-12]
MKNIKNHFSLILLFITHIVMAQIPCSAGFTGNGTNDYITIPNTDAINLQNTRNRTVEFWFKPSDISTRQVLYEEGAQVNVIMFFIEDGRVYVGGYRNDANTAARRRFFRSAIGDIAVDKWTHIAFTIEDTTSPDITFKWFLDGVEQDEQDGLQVSKHSGNISIGRNGGNIRYPSTFANASWGGSGIGTYNGTFTGQNSASNNFEGNISLLRIWNTARSESEINTNKSEYIISNLVDKLVAYQDGDSMIYDSNNNGAINADTTANGSGTSYTWTSGSGSFYTAANWLGTTFPDVTKTQTVIIQNGTPSLTTEVKIGRLTVNSGAEMIVQSGATLNIFYELTNNGTITVEDGGALIFHSCNTTIAGSGTFNIKRQTPTYAGNDFYSYWSSPLIEANSSPSVIFPDAELIYSFGAGVSNADWVYNGASNLKTGLGYAIQNEGLGGQLRTFTGKINEGDVEVDVFYNTNLASTDSNNVWSLAGDNLVGNPYASAIDWDLIAADTDNADIDGTVYFWNQNTAENGDNNVSDYLQYNLTGGTSNTATGKIGTGQGFFVKTSSNSKITFKTTHQIVANNTQFFRGTASKETLNKDGRSWFTFNHEGKTNTILVGFLKGATNRIDRLFDAEFDINEKSLGFYSLVKGIDKVSIQGLPVLKRDKKVVKLGFVVDKVGSYSIGIQDELIDEDYYIYLRDTENKITVDLRQRSYPFTIDSIGENNTRFKVIYTKKKRKSISGKTEGKQSFTVEEIDSKDFTVYVDGGKELIVAYDFDVDNVKEISLYNIQGRKVAAFLGAQTKDVSNLSTGIYIVAATLKDNSVFNKKIMIAN